MRALKIILVIAIGVACVTVTAHVLLHYTSLERYRPYLQELYATVISYSNAETLTPNVNDAIEDERVAEQVCDWKVPKHGGHFELSTFKGNLKEKSRVFISNAHIYPIWIKFYDSISYEDQIRVYLEPNKSHLFYLPINDYYIEVNAGEKWCSTESGFVEPYLVESDKLINVQTNEVVNLKVFSFGNHPSNMMLSMSSNSSGFSGKRIQGTGSLILDRIAGGHFPVHGTINHQPTYFIVDTGASIVSIPTSFARHAGITECRKSKSITAGGIVDACRATAKTMTIGQFTLKNVQISYGKGLEPDTFLLGMNVISQFKMEQQGGVMKLTVSR